MGLDEMMSTETAFVAAATAAVLSPKTRDVIRKGAVYGVAGALKVGDVVAGAARGAVRGVRSGDGATSDAAAAASSRTTKSTATSREPAATPASRRRRPATPPPPGRPARVPNDEQLG